MNLVLGKEAVVKVEPPSVLIDRLYPPANARIDPFDEQTILAIPDATAEFKLVHVAPKSVLLYINEVDISDPRK